MMGFSATLDSALDVYLHSCYVCTRDNNFCSRPRDFRVEEAEIWNCTGSCVKHEFKNENNLVSRVQRYCTYDEIHSEGEYQETVINIF